MTLEKAFEELITTEEFKAVAKQTSSHGSRYRMYLLRYKKGELKAGALVEILIENGYEVTAKRAVKRKTKK